nr:MAG TPA: hypothetical protein [Caudoviricetes sp.]
MYVIIRLISQRLTRAGRCKLPRPLFLVLHKSVRESVRCE